MNTLDNLKTSYNHKITVYVPSTVDVNKQGDTSEWQTQAATLLSTNFGGATATKGFGYWVDDDGETVSEDVTMIYSYCNEKAYNAYIDSVVKFCKKMCAALGQEAVSLEVDNALYFVKAKKEEAQSGDDTNAVTLTEYYSKVKI